MLNIKNTKKSKFTNLLIAICILICILCIDILFLNMYNSYDKSRHILDTQNEYRLVDLEISTSDFIRNYKKVISIKSFHEELINNSNFIYYESIIQPTNVFNFKGNEIFLYNYEENLGDVEGNNRDIEYQNVKQLLINNNYAKKINLADIIQEGQNFKKEDYYTDNHKEIPAILGNDYIGVYKIGDTIDVMLQQDVYATYKVIGFLKPNSSAMVNGELIFLDRYIVSPSLNIRQLPEDIGELMYQGFLYLQKSNGIVKLSQGYKLQSFLSDLESLRIKYNIFDIGILNYSMLEINSLKMLVYEDIEMLVILFIVMFTFSAISIISHMIILINASLYTYKVYLLSGYSIREIQRSIFYKLLLLIFIPISISMMFIYFFLNEFKVLLFCFNIFFGITFFILTFIIVKIYFHNITMEKLIKGDSND